MLDFFNTVFINPDILYINWCSYGKMLSSAFKINHGVSHESLVFPWCSVYKWAFRQVYNLLRNHCLRVTHGNKQNN